MAEFEPTALVTIFGSVVFMPLEAIPHFFARYASTVRISLDARAVL